MRDDSDKNSIDIDYMYFIKETDENAKIKFSDSTSLNRCDIFLKNMANIDDRALWECSSDLNSDGEITSDDAVIFYSLLKWAENPSVKSSVSFSDYYNELVIAEVLMLIFHL